MAKRFILGKTRSKDLRQKKITIFEKSEVFLNNKKYAQKHLIHEKYQN